MCSPAHPSRPSPGPGLGGPGACEARPDPMTTQFCMLPATIQPALLKFIEPAGEWELCGKPQAVRSLSVVCKHHYHSVNFDIVERDF